MQAAQTLNEEKVKEKTIMRDTVENGSYGEYPSGNLAQAVS